MNTIIRWVSAGFLLVGIARLEAQEKALPITPGDALISQRFGTPFKVPLGVESVVISQGTQRRQLEGFELVVTAFFLRLEKVANHEAASKLIPTDSSAVDRWFHRHGTDQFSYVIRTKGDSVVSNEEKWRDVRRKIGIKGKPLFELKPEEFFPNFTIVSNAKMDEGDIASLRSFEFAPSHPGLYRLRLELFKLGDRKSGTLADERMIHVYFECPNYQPVLSSQSILDPTKPDTIELRDIGYKYINTPVVADVFFEDGDVPRFNENSTDRLFRSLLFGRVAASLSYPPSRLELHAFPDPLCSKDHKQPLKRTLERSRDRAQYLKNELQRLSSDYIASIRRVGNSSQPRGIEIDTAGHDLSDSLAQTLIKREDSIDDSVKYRQENRTIALRVSKDLEERLFSPLRFPQNEVSDCIKAELSLAGSERLTRACVDSAWMIVRRTASGVTAHQKLTEDEVKALSAGKINVFLDSLRSFTSIPGNYEVTAAIRSRCDDTTLYSQPLKFHVRSKSVLLDEIFALSLFDSAAFSHAYDEKRLSTIVDTLFAQIESALAQSDDDRLLAVQILISGHTDVLADNRGPFYNLGLSYERAHFLQRKLVEQIQQKYPRRGFASQGPCANGLGTSEDYYISPIMKKRMTAQEYAKPRTQEFFEKRKKEAKATTPLSEYYERIKADKLRHFSTEPRRPFDPILPYSIGAIKAKLKTIDDNVVHGLKTIGLCKGEQQVTIEIVTAGFGSAIPFYRRFRTDVSEELKTLLCAGGLQPKDIPQEIFADDDWPSGRVMNRRIEVSFAITRASAEAKGFTAVKP